MHGCYFCETFRFSDLQVQGHVHLQLYQLMVFLGIDIRLTPVPWVSHHLPKDCPQILIPVIIKSVVSAWHGGLCPNTISQEVEARGLQGQSQP